MALCRSRNSVAAVGSPTADYDTTENRTAQQPPTSLPNRFPHSLRSFAHPPSERSRSGERSSPLMWPEIKDFWLPVRTHRVITMTEDAKRLPNHSDEPALAGARADLVRVACFAHGSSLPVRIRGSLRSRRATPARHHRSPRLARSFARLALHPPGELRSPEPLRSPCDRRTPGTAPPPTLDRFSVRALRAGRSAPRPVRRSV